MPTSDAQSEVRSRSRYARLERERRWLLSDLPAEPHVRRTLEIYDRYLPGTSLRLRVIEEAGASPVCKLGHKVRLRQDEPSTVAHTTMYLDDAARELLAAIPADELTKTRHLLAGGEPPWAVDVFHGELDGLVLAEVDLGGRPDPSDLEPPAPSAIEVTCDVRFTGGALARYDRSDLATVLRDVRP